MKISIIIIVKDDLTISTTLAAIQQQYKPVETEVIVVDRSAKTALQSVRQEFPDTKWLFYKNKEQKKFTFSGQRNMGLQAAKGELIVFVDCGCDLEKRWLATLWQASKKYPIICSVLKPRTGHAVFQSGPLSKAIDEIPEGPSNGMAVRREVFDKTGGFDERLTYGEDVDIQWRARAHGFGAVRHEKAVVYHDWGGVKQGIKRSFRYGAARAKLYRKHPRNWRQLIGYDAVVPAYSLFMLGLPLTYWYPAYLLILLIPILKNIGKHPFSLVATYLVYGCGVLWGAVTPGLDVNV